MSRRWLAALVVLVLALLLLLRGGPEAAAPMAPAPAAAPAAPPAAEKAPAKAAERVSVRVPRPTRPTRPPPRPAPVDEAPADGPRDRRPDPPADASAVRELLQQQMEEVRLAVLPCVERWAAADPQLDGTVKLRFGVTADGLEDVWIEDHQAVPAEMLDCFSDGVYGTDWAGITREPIEVSWPFHVTADPP